MIGIEPTPDQARVAIEGYRNTSNFLRNSVSTKKNAIASSSETIEHLYSPLNFFVGHMAYLAIGVTDDVLPKFL